jgi:hypothetical protein
LPIVASARDGRMLRAARQKFTKDGASFIAAAGLGLEPRYHAHVYY